MSWKLSLSLGSTLKNPAKLRSFVKVKTCLSVTSFLRREPLYGAKFPNNIIGISPQNSY